ncbi:carboxyl transferase domain-containing protein [Tomitella gaofuii]|uniref:carboxyl transferase domain-containing protein n=1 Tax=Tomitella gaofuii TaxID=2760083 RepID=UPI001F404253|nr:carboxyl transferase domain-containing protein [Tomitella gaofuii]
MTLNPRDHAADGAGPQPTAGMRILVANRGEIAVRIIRAIHELGATAVAVHPDDDAASLHVRRADEAVRLPGVGTAAYLDIAAVIGAAADSHCDALHPGYGFLSENAEFARRCAAAGVTFLGPDADVLAMLGDKSRARALAVDHGVPVLPGTPGPTSLEEVQEFAAAHGPVMIKAVSGGGGRGMRAVTDPAGLADAYERCASEARAAFGDDALYVERLALAPRHIEIQVVGDGTGVQHLGERDCSVQRRNQKIIEIAPSPALGPELRARIIADALRLASALDYRGLGTFEFLVDGDEHYFMEANPRLQVEHTVTEQISGVDLVSTQIRVCTGASLAAVGLSEPPPLHGYAVQARVNCESLDETGAPLPSSGTITAFAVPSGPSVRVDTCGYIGYQVSPRYDSLIAKVIGTSGTFAGAARRTADALAEFTVDGPATNLDLNHAILTNASFLSGTFDTGFIAENAPALLAHRRPHGDGAPDEGADGAADAATASDDWNAPAGALRIDAPMAGVLVRLGAAAGDTVGEGTVVGVVEAMKMEHPVRAPAPLRIDAVLADAGGLVEAGQCLAYGSPAATATDTPSRRDDRSEGEDQDDWSAEIAEIERRRAAARQMGGPDKVRRQHDSGRRTARERIDSLADPGTFREIGALTAFVDYDEDGTAVAVQPANFVAGTAEIDGRKTALGIDDFTVRGGAGDAAIHDKQIFLERYAREMRLPMVRLLDGASGGGSVKMVRDAGFNYVPVNPGWDAVVDLLSLAPVVSVAMGPTVGLGAARFVMSHLAVMVEGTSQLFTAGPPVVFGGTGEKLTKDELGGIAVHRRNGSVERTASDEDAAMDTVRRFLGYLPRNVFELPPVQERVDPPVRRAESLLRAIPRSKRTGYDIAPILDAVFDAGSVFPYAEYGDSTVTALARLDGHPVGVIGTDPRRGAAMSVEGAQAIGRLVDLCETFHLPIVSLTDQAGVNIGSAAESRASIRAGARAISAVYQARVPQAEVILRRVYGVGGAGIVNRHRASRSWAWPSGDWGSLPARGGIEAAFKAEIAASGDPEGAVRRIGDELERYASPLRTAEHFGIQDLIDPRDTRPLLCDWVADAYRVLPELLGPPSMGMRP